MKRRHSSYQIFFSNKTVLQRHRLSRTNKKNGNYIVCREIFLSDQCFFRVISLWTQISKQHSRPDPKSFLDFPIICKIFPFLFLIVLTVLILKPLLHAGHFYLHWQENTSFECCRDYPSVARVARVRFCNKIAETMLQNIK